MRRTPKWRYWRVALADGSRIVVGRRLRAAVEDVLARPERIEARTRRLRCHESLA